MALTGLTLFSLKALGKKERALERTNAAHRQTVQELLDRMMHVTGKPWVPTPRETKAAIEEEIDEDTQLALQGWTDA